LRENVGKYAVYPCREKLEKTKKIVHRKWNAA